MGDGGETHAALEKLSDIRPDELTPRQALDLIYKLKALAR